MMLLGSENLKHVELESFSKRISPIFFEEIVCMCIFSRILSQDGRIEFSDSCLRLA